MQHDYSDAYTDRPEYHKAGGGQLAAHNRYAAVERYLFDNTGKWLGSSNDESTITREAAIALYPEIEPGLSGLPWRPEGIGPALPICSECQFAFFPAHASGMCAECRNQIKEAREPDLPRVESSSVGRHPPAGAAVSPVAKAFVLGEQHGLSVARKGEHADHRIERRAGEIRRDLCEMVCFGVSDDQLHELGRAGLARVMALAEIAGMKGVGNV